MDLKIVHRGIDGSLSFSFGMKPRTRIFEAAQAGAKSVRVEDVSGFRTGMKIVLGDFPIPADYDPSIDEYITQIESGNIGNMETFVVQGIDLVNSALYITPPVMYPRPVAGAVLAIAAEYKAELYTGLLELAQYVEKTLLTTAGSDALEPLYGSTMYTLLGMNNNEDNHGLIATKINAIVGDVEAYIRKTQDKENKDPDAILSKLIVRSVYYDYNISRWRVDVDVTAASGRIYTSTL